MTQELHSPTNGQMVLDTELLGTLEAVLGEDLQDVVAFFCSNLPDMIDTLLHSLRAGDHEPIQQQAHRLKGSAGSMGALALSSLAQEIEQLARQRRAIPACRADALSALAAATHSALGERYQRQAQASTDAPLCPRPLGTE
ncbi:Hpt domain-containing protein [Pseudomonas oryzae]|uniref:Hpt domain-containing protein n=1 Tax=Pseudomonas oryzae TaxID=1392877 RepID=UPI000B825265|nr:Hpt domain-containing protein [Pseudomonas oryzae]